MTIGTGAPGGRAGASNLRQRVLSAIVLVVVVLVLTWAGGIWFSLLAALIAAAVLHEWTGMMARPENGTHRLVLGGLLAILLIALLLGVPASSLLLLLVLIVLAGAAHAFYAGAGPWPVAGLCYAGLSALSLAFVRGDDAAGLMATLFLFAVVWVTDILAYFVGKALGGPKLAPSISPGKTWSGAMGGALGGVAAGVIATALGGAVHGLLAVALVALILSAISQGGDLFESSLKRRFQVKDSSRLIPGHGGVMDRVDGLVAAAFAMMVFGAAVAGIEAPAHALFAR